MIVVPAGREPHYSQQRLTVVSLVEGKLLQKTQYCSSIYTFEVLNIQYRVGTAVSDNIYKLFLLIFKLFISFTRISTALRAVSFYVPLGDLPNCIQKSQILEIPKSQNPKSKITKSEIKNPKNLSKQEQEEESCSPISIVRYTPTCANIFVPILPQDGPTEGSFKVRFNQTTMTTMMGMAHCSITRRGKAAIVCITTKDTILFKQL